MKKGIESLKQAVITDCEKHENCFSETGCTNEFYKTLPQDNPDLLQYGKTKCVRSVKCFNNYCDKYKWVIDRAAHYAEKSGKTVNEVIEIWENDRTYWYMNYYQESNQPLLESDKIIPYEQWRADLIERFGKDPKNWEFVCPNCGNVQTLQMFLDHSVPDPENKFYFSCIGRWVKGIGCDWTLGGLLKVHTVSVLKDAEVFPVFETNKKARVEAE